MTGAFAMNPITDEMTGESRRACRTDLGHRSLGVGVVSPGPLQPDPLTLKTEPGGSFISGRTVA